MGDQHSYLSGQIWNIWAHAMWIKCNWELLKYKGTTRAVVQLAEALSHYQLITNSRHDAVNNLIKSKKNFLGSTIVDASERSGLSWDVLNRRLPWTLPGEAGFGVIRHLFHMTRWEIINYTASEAHTSHHQCQLPLVAHPLSKGWVLANLDRPSPDGHLWRIAQATETHEPSKYDSYFTKKKLYLNYF